MTLGRDLRILKGYNTLHELIQKGKSPLYDFSNSLYIKDDELLEVVCKIHGNFWMRPNDLKRGSLCPSCVGNIQKTTSSYRKELEGGFPEIIVVGEYKTAKIKILHKHKICGHEWLIAPTVILRGHGCPKCAKTGFNPKKPAILYYISVSPPKGLIKFKEANGLLPIKEIFKIGITNRSVKERFTNEELQRIRVIKEEYFEDGQEAYNK